MSIMVLGTLALDTVKTPYGKKQDMLGGSAAHFAMAARLFTPVDLVAVIGRDFPVKYLRFLKQKGIELGSVATGSGASFRWHGEYKDNLNTAITLYTQLGVLEDFDPRISESQRRIKYLFLANIDPDIQRYLLKHMHSLKVAGLDSMNYWINNKRKALVAVLKGIDIFFANENEARQLSGEHNLVRAAVCLGRMGPAMVVIKKGEHGVLFYCRDFIFSLPAYPVRNIVDPTGAGDTFAGGFMGYLASNGRLNAKNIKRAIAYGVVCSSFNVEGFGLNRTSRLSLKDVNKRLAALKDFTAYGL